MFTRKDYLDHKCSHSEYYAQFVDEQTHWFVRDVIGTQRVKESADPHLNDIPLHLWDKYRISRPQNTLLHKAGDFFSLSTAVCIAKEAARQLAA